MSPGLGSTLDLIVILFYFFAILIFGSFFGKYTKTTKDFFFAGQRFSWWLIAMSCIATLVGSYSFVKYSNQSYANGFTATHAYLNDWPWLFLWLFGWLPVLYYARVSSVPDYFEKRFGSGCRMAATFILLIYMIGYIGYNFLTIGVALEPILNWNLYVIVVTIAVIAAIYVTAGGQTAVIMTDLFQGFLLLLAGLLILLTGIEMAGGFQAFWQSWPTEHRRAFMPVTEPAGFNTAGVFWQDGMANSAAFWFMNQGIILRFLSVRNVKEGRKAMLAIVLLLIPLAAISVCCSGWVGRVLVEQGGLDIPEKSETVFVLVADAVSRFLQIPGMFGLIIAALTAALMSTADTLINGVAVIATHDVIRPYVWKDKPDKFYLKCARWLSIITALIGIALVPLFHSFGNLYDAHAAFTAAVTPPMVMAILMGFMWKRYSAIGAMATLIGGIILMIISMIEPAVIYPFSHGIDADGQGIKAYKYIRACYGMVMSGVLGVIFTYLSHPPIKDKLLRYVWGSERVLMREFKGVEPNTEQGIPVRLTIRVHSDLGENEVRLPFSAQYKMNAKNGDLVFLSHPGWFHGGLKSAHGQISGESQAEAEVSEALLQVMSVSEGEVVVVEKTF
ncbi:MAG: sodium:solute symporter family protein [Candidatus Omnitrophota bacterium]|jgi:SSS family solute:Na+ symporter|nr:MAG: sodium:solute symporter family protein [Candidatus Omnitrophota bacterium]